MSSIRRVRHDTLNTRSGHSHRRTPIRSAAGTATHWWWRATDSMTARGRTTTAIPTPKRCGPLRDIIAATSAIRISKSRFPTRRPPRDPGPSKSARSWPPTPICSNGSATRKAAAWNTGSARLPTKRNPGSRSRPIAQSDTGFSGLYGLGVEFTKGASGTPAPELFVKHVSGDYRFTRK